MRISAVGNFACQPRQNVNFKGILIEKGSSFDSWDYHGEVSASSGPDGHYVGSNDTQDYVYHPFKDEPEHVIKKKIEEGNYYSDYTSMGYGGGLTVSTERGKTLPYTEREWNRLSKDNQEKIKSLL